LRSTILDDANFTGANLQGARLDDASMQGTKGLPARMVTEGLVIAQ
jgi:uncharacterized protein YjbI with pentapeptide repeats